MVPYNAAIYASHAVILFSLNGFTAQSYAIVVLAVALCLSICVCVCLKLEFYENRWTNRASSGVGASFDLSYTTF